ncbi:MAG: hypothetical protein LBK95_11910 [Bifidobacteriaceae bacterium]|nr:hypothetical protein [Bifidobacteriaceae bacterium]
MFVRLTGQVVAAERRTFQRNDGSSWTRSEIEIMVAFRGVTTVSVREENAALPSPGDLVDILAKFSGEYRGSPQFDVIGPWQDAWSGDLLNPAAFAPVREPLAV